MLLGSLFHSSASFFFYAGFILRQWKHGSFRFYPISSTNSGKGVPPLQKNPGLILIGSAYITFSLLKQLLWLGYPATLARPGSRALLWSQDVVQPHLHLRFWEWEEFPKVESGTWAAKTETPTTTRGWLEPCSITLYMQSHLVGLGCDLRICTSNRLPGDGSAAVSWTTLCVARGILPGVTASLRFIQAVQCQPISHLSICLLLPVLTLYLHTSQSLYMKCFSSKFFCQLVNIFTILPLIIRKCFLTE